MRLTRVHGFTDLVRVGPDSLDSRHGQPSADSVNETAFPSSFRTRFAFHRLPSPLQSTGVTRLRRRSLRSPFVERTEELLKKNPNQSTEHTLASCVSATL